MGVLFVEATNALVETLRRIDQALSERRLPEAKALLEAAAPNLAQYLSRVDQAIAEADDQIAALKTRAEHLSIEIDAGKRELSALQDQITRLRGETSGLEARHADLAVKTATLTPLVTILETAVKIRTEKLAELEKWFWVPGYGQYLAIRTLVDEDITGLRSSRQELSHFSRELAGNEKALLDLRSALEDLTKQVSSMGSRSSQLQQLAERADHELARAKERTAFLIAARSFMAEVNAIASNFESFSLPRLTALLSRLDGRSLDSRMSVLNRQSNTFSHDLREFAMAIGAGASFLTYAPASGNAVEIANRGAFVIKVRIAAHADGADSAGRSPWTRGFAVGGVERIDLRPLRLADNDVFWVEASAVMGPTFRSGDIRYIEQSSPEIARFTAAGTIFSAALHHEP